MARAALPEDRAEPERGEEDAERPLRQRRRRGGEPEPRPPAADVPGPKREQGGDRDREGEEAVPPRRRDLPCSDVGEQVREAPEEPGPRIEAATSGRHDQPRDDDRGDGARK